MARTRAPSPIERTARGLGSVAGHTVRLLMLPRRVVRRLFEGEQSASSTGQVDEYPAAEIAAEEGLTALCRALSDPDPRARLLALDVVCEFSEERAARLIAGMLGDPEPRVRRAAAEAAGRLRVFGVVFTLILALDDDAASVRSAAVTAIEQITGREVGLDGASPPDAIAARMKQLKRWWKQQRFDALVAATESRTADG